MSRDAGLAIIVSNYVILELGISMELLINVVSAFEAPSVNSSPWVSYDSFQFRQGTLILTTR